MLDHASAPKVSFPGSSSKARLRRFRLDTLAASLPPNWLKEVEVGAAVIKKHGVDIKTWSHALIDEKLTSDSGTFQEHYTCRI